MKRFCTTLIAIFSLFISTYAEDHYDVIGVYNVFPEEIATNAYHYIEYDDVYYLPIKLQEELMSVEILEKINSTLYRICLSNNTKEDNYLLLRYPAFLQAGDRGVLDVSNFGDSDLIIYDEIKLFM